MSTIASAPSAGTTNNSTNSNNKAKFQVFLGGSCNPTTWRQTVAIPYLETNGISYYNPQIENWTPDVVSTERIAKQCAQIFLFVIDCQTRSTVSIIESAFMAGQGENLVLVIYPFGNNGTIRIDGEPISVHEFHELSYARLLLQNLVALRKIPMFMDISQALSYVSSRLNDETEVNSKQSSAATLLEDLSNLSMHSYDADKKPRGGIASINRNSSIEDKLCFREMAQHDTIKDVYLSLDNDDHTINESSVIPILEEKGLTYNYTSPEDRSTFLANLPPRHDPEGSPNTLGNGKLTRTTDMSVVSEQTRLAMDKEICAIKSSRVLLFVITNKCRGLSIMVPASYFMALFRNNVVLCVQYLEEPCSIGGELLTTSAINDYNRGRVYLCDYANKSQVPVFSTIHEAIECCSRKCRRYDNKD